MANRAVVTVLDVSTKADYSDLDDNELQNDVETLFIYYVFSDFSGLGQEIIGRFLKSDLEDLVKTYIIDQDMIDKRARKLIKWFKLLPFNKDDTIVFEVRT